MVDFTQAQIEELTHEATLSAPEGTQAELAKDIERLKVFPNQLGRFLTKFIDMQDSANLDKYRPVPKVVDNGVRRRPEKTNPWSKEGWHLGNQGKLVSTLGEKKASEIAAAAGCRIGSTKFNPDYV